MIASYKYTEELHDLSASLGMSVFGIADLEPVRQTFHPQLEGPAKGLKYGIVAGIRLSDPVIEDIVDQPTFLYKYHYQVANDELDRAVAGMAFYIQQKGFKALPIPASQTVDWVQHLGHLSHKALAVQAGLGWIGRSALFIHPVHRARLRLVSVLTDLPLVPGSPVRGECGACRLCLAACPAGAITEQGYDKPKCIAKLHEFSRRPGINQYICGVCVKACQGGIQTTDNG
jgi:epoxyqueuosine reductase